ncbi:hypothetical protein QE152_g41466 [Popillia japonica]|uniref:Uncharacterized protein n=1 Tax=Popillia japonica TaxID=7064 RepID=A0AAW1GB81_POPJA
MRDAETREILYLAFVENHVICSYSPRLIEASIDERKMPKIGLRDAFSQVERLVSGKGMVRLYVNYEQLPKFMTLYMGEKNKARFGKGDGTPLCQL